MTIRARVVAVFATLIVLLFAIIYTMGQMAYSNEKLAKSHLLRFNSHKLAAQLRQSSDDLTRMARTYVVTGDQKYEKIFNEILAIRDGTAPRPQDYDEVYWDIIIHTGKASTSFGPPVALLDLLKRSDLTDQELAKLEQSKNISDELANIEKVAFAAMKGLFDDGSGNLTVKRKPDPAFSSRILHGDEYHKAKGAIMVPIREFTTLVDQRTGKEVDAIAADEDFYRNILFILIAITLLFSVFAYSLLSGRIVNPILLLARTAKRIEEGDHSARATITSSDELGELNDAFNRMTRQIQKAKDEADSANKAKSDFLAAMSHDLRTPLNAIMGFSEMMLSKTFGDLGNQKYGQYAKDIHDSGSLLVGLINDILDLSKIEAGKYQLEEEDIEVSSIIGLSFRQLNRMANTAKQTLSINVVPGDLTMCGDKRALTQLLNNLISNAIKFTPAKGKISVSAVLNELNGIVLTVSDTGIGMSDEGITKALQPFEQAEARHSRRHEGSGLGLHLCVNFMKLFGGDLTIESEVGKGTVITLCFPPERTILPPKQ